MGVREVDIVNGILLNAAKRAIKLRGGDLVAFPESLRHAAGEAGRNADPLLSAIVREAYEVAEEQDCTATAFARGLQYVIDDIKLIRDEALNYAKRYEEE